MGMAKCPKCSALLENENVPCGSCGWTPAGATASFTPVGELDTEQVESGLEGPVLVVRKGPQLGERFFLDRPTFTIGRDPGSDIFLNDMTVSREHATLCVDADGAVSVTDAGSLNGTYVNGACLDKANLTDGDVLQIGTFQMVFHGGTVTR